MYSEHFQKQILDYTDYLKFVFKQLEVISSSAILSILTGLKCFGSFYTQNLKELFLIEDNIVFFFFSFIHQISFKDKN